MMKVELSPEEIELIIAGVKCFAQGKKQISRDTLDALYKWGDFWEKYQASKNPRERLSEWTEKNIKEFERELLSAENIKGKYLTTSLEKTHQYFENLLLPICRNIAITKVCLLGSVLWACIVVEFYQSRGKILDEHEAAQIIGEQLGGSPIGHKLMTRKDGSAEGTICFIELTTEMVLKNG